VHYDAVLIPDRDSPLSGRLLVYEEDLVDENFATVVDRRVSLGEIQINASEWPQFDRRDLERAALLHAVDSALMAAKFHRVTDWFQSDAGTYLASVERTVPEA
jgi:hypothetical protein